MKKWVQSGGGKERFDVAKDQTFESETMSVFSKSR